MIAKQSKQQIKIPMVKFLHRIIWITVTVHFIGHFNGFPMTTKIKYIGLFWFKVRIPVAMPILRRLFKKLISKKKYIRIKPQNQIKDVPQAINVSDLMRHRIDIDLLVYIYRLVTQHMLKAKCSHHSRELSSVVISWKMKCT